MPAGRFLFRRSPSIHAFAASSPAPFLLAFVLAASAILIGCRSAGPAPGAKPARPPGYVVRAGGPHSYTVITNPPNSQPVTLSLLRDRGDGIDFRLSNGLPHAILLWNVRVQVRVAGPGTDGFGWETVADDYPNAAPASRNQASCPPGGVMDFQVTHPGRTPWRVCALFATDWNDSGRTYSGNDEALGPELTE